MRVRILHRRLARLLGAALLLVAGGLSPTTARAFHSAMLFPDDASVGGGGGYFYNGSPRHKGYTCAACHLEPPGLARLDVTSEPPSLLADRVYEPGQSYALTVRLVGETRGLDAFVNYNTFSVEVIDAELEPAGTFASFVEGGLVTTIELDALFARGRSDVAAEEWTFEWQAPDPAAGRVDFYLAGVDGDGAGETAEEATDPRGDDVMTAHFSAWPTGDGAPPPDTGDGGAGGCSARRPGGGGALAVVGLIGAALCQVTRRRSRQSVPL